MEKLLEGLSDSQKDAVGKVVDWYKDRESKQTFSITGGPGTGKTFLVNRIIEILKLQPHQVKFCTFTGRASLVLWDRGIPSTTIHQLIYVTEVIEEQKVDANGEVFIKKEMRTYKRNSISPLIRLIVADEASMIEKKILDDLLSFGIKIICLGDLDQLPPVKGFANDILDNPDVTLRENFRQGQGNSILDLAYDIRDGFDIDYGRYGDNVIVLPKENISPEFLNMTDQILCTTNKRRHEINNMMRAFNNRTSASVQPGDKVIITGNNWERTEYCSRIQDDLPLVNGLIGTCVNIKGDDRIKLIDFVPDFDTGIVYKELKVDSLKFGDRHKGKPLLKSKDLDEFTEMDYGYAITIHKSQGSEFKSLSLIIDEMFGGPDMIKKLLYTGITRASEKLIIYK